MYCSNCAYDFDSKLIKEASKNQTSKTSKKVYVCPRCGHLIHTELNPEEVKHLSQAAHAEVHRAHNTKNSGFCSLVIGLILIAISFLFFLMSFKVANKRQMDANCIEFYVFSILFIFGFLCDLYSIFALVVSTKKEKKYSKLISHIQNETFVQ